MKKWPAACWDADDAVAMVNFEAGSPDDAHDLDRGNHVFEATHTPPAVREVTAAEFRENQSGQGRSQADVLGALEDGKPFVFVAGVPGTGKSHLVRWLHLNRAESGAATPDELSCYLPRRMTSLRDVLRAVLQFADDDVRQQLEDDLASATAGLTPEEARRQFLANLAAVIETRVPEIKRGTDTRFQLRDHIELVDDLHEFLRARPVREYLCRVGGSIERLITARLEGKRDETLAAADEEMRFSPEELAGLAELDMQGVAKEAERLHSKINNSGHLRAAMGALLGPVHTDPALQRLIGIGTGQLQEAMTDALASLRSNGKRLVLYFEDWGLISGFQEELAEAIAAAEGTALGVVAITTDRLQEQRNNVLERGRIFILDPPGRAVPGGALDEAHPGAADLTAHALNAIRWGREELRQTYDSRQSHDGWLTSKCEKDCPFDVSSRCLETFGSVEVDGVGEVGLFPFTRASLNNALNRKSAGGAAVPRVVLHEVVRNALSSRYAAQLDAGKFPSPEFADEFAPERLRLTGAAPAALERRLADAGAASDLSRFRAFLETYRTDLAVDSFDDRIRSSFSLPDTLQGSGGVGPGQGGKGDPPPPPPPPPVDMPPLAKEAFELAKGGTVTAARELRELVAREVLVALPTHQPIWRRAEWSKVGIDYNHVALAGAKKYAAEGPELFVPMEEADALAYLAWSEDRPHGWRETESVEIARAITDSALDRWTQQAVDQLFGDINSRERAVEALMRVLALSGIAAGMSSSLTSENVLDVVFGEVDQPPMTDLDRVGTGGKDRQATLEVLLRYVGFAQGVGDVNAIDHDFVWPIARRIVDDPSAPIVENLPGDTPDWAQSLHATLESTVGHEFQTVRDWWAGYGDTLTSRETVFALIDELRRLQATARNARNPDTQQAVLKQKDVETANQLLAAVDRLQRSIEEADDAGVDPFESLSSIGSILESEDDLGLVRRIVSSRELRQGHGFRLQLRTLYLNALDLVGLVEERLPEGLTGPQIDTSELAAALVTARSGAEKLGAA